MPFEELKGLLSEEDYKRSVEEWGRPTKVKKWYHMTVDAFINFMYQVRHCSHSSLFKCLDLSSVAHESHTSGGIQREIAKAQEEAIRQYRDTLVAGDGRMVLGSSEDLITLANAAVKKTKTQLATDMTCYLAIADPRNGVEFIHEVENSRAMSISALIVELAEESFGSEGLSLGVNFSL